jgi:hypothetical protein
MLRNLERDGFAAPLDGKRVVNRREGSCGVELNVDHNAHNLNDFSCCLTHIFLL